MESQLKDFKERFSGTIAELDDYISLINLISKTSNENNINNGFALLKDCIIDINKKSKYYIGSNYSIYSIVEDAKLFLKDDELSKFSDFSQKALEIRKDNFNTIKNFSNKFDSTYEKEIANVFFENYNGGKNLFLDENIFIGIVNSINEMLNYFEDVVSDLNSQTPNEIKNVKYLSNPQKIKIIEKLNLYGFLQTKGFSKTNFEFLLSQLFDISDKQVRTSFSNKKHEVFAENFIEELKKRPSIRT